MIAPYFAVADHGQTALDGDLYGIVASSPAELADAIEAEARK